ncbi:UDP-N-acetylglucosamine 2-epimerase (non-hydrolyzing) [Candidatus Chloroploca sp. M-50]|uniref:UDP-N-acetylglucosamine 2-epimerase (Non-hydrolyzing) n=1 Tax=Candidatus Chloroploca mongolica TaxID=2528176 RepID=A0ABS4D5N1_9CHLR|nr:UDP-N-acetylglucosamine 2-epimerase (non-hydrolyzing) [Candidatus Chloroploca mongolica]MBP1464744.1 UDP-N-acetylglucosamine 2-epimerase (non-hydrolyzing) [Candidatus Chloroploca mongolica]
MNILTVLGARPQFIKAAPVSKALREAGHHEYLVHTGQHYDHAMSQIFFDELGIPQPDVNLGVGSGGHGKQTGAMLMRLEEVILEQRPDWVLVYGDTNSTLAGALAAVKLHVPVAHVEAGLRSFNRTMPEEHNRILTDHCADLLFCPTQTAVNNLAHEGITQGVHLVGDTMYDAVLQFGELARQRSRILETLGLTPKQYLLATVHRPYNTDNPEHLRSIIAAFVECGETVIFPVHPRTRARLAEADVMAMLKDAPQVRLIEPVGYLDMLMLEQHARMILTDSGGMQKEAYFFAVPCLTLRPETEWVETVEAGWNVVVGASKERIVTTLAEHTWPSSAPPAVFGAGQAALQSITILATITQEKRSV